MIFFVSLKIRQSAKDGFEEHVTPQVRLTIPNQAYLTIPTSI